MSSACNGAVVIFSVAHTDISHMLGYIQCVCVSMMLAILPPPPGYDTIRKSLTWTQELSD